MEVESVWRERLRARLLEWYTREARELPWRARGDPYATWVSEIMLQQTQVTTVIPYYERWMARFPTLRALAEASLDEVLKHWEGLGYYARARNLHRAAREVVERHGGELPPTVEGLRALPGIGRYTAGAIASIAFGLPVAALDGNLKRVFARLVRLEEPVNRPAGEKALWKLASALVPTEHAGAWNQALMDLGATICTARRPRCPLCPLSDLCAAREAGEQDAYPRRAPRRARPHHVVTAGVIRERASDRLLIARRPADKMLGGLWEFPGGKCEPGETLDACLRRELREELGIEVEVHDELAVVDHAYTHFTIRLHALVCTHVGGDPIALGVDEFRWVHPADLEEYAWPRTDLRIIEALRERGEFT